MKHEVKTQDQLLHELASMRERVAELEASESQHNRVEEKYHTIVETSSEAIWLLDADGRITYVNPKMVEMLGYAPQEIVGKSSLDFFVEEAPGAGLEHREQRRRGISARHEHRFRRKDGTFLDTIVSATPFIDEKGRYIGQISLHMDITERKRLEENLRASEAKYRTIVETANEGIWLMDAVDRIAYASPAMAAMLGYATEEMVGKRPSDFLSEEGRRLHAAHLKQRRKGLSGQHEARLLRKDSTSIGALVSATPLLDDQGRYNGRVSIFLDITERKRAEQQLTAQSAVLEGINTVLREAMVAETEEAVGKTALAVAEALTGSKFGFLGEVNQAGRFDSIALSDPGWQACRIPDSEATQITKAMEVRGIWGRVIKDEKSFFTNDPALHPERVGIPPGHPPLTSFLGVPLQRDGKTIGMIGLANKEHLYDEHDIEVVEALAGATVQALMRKRAELQTAESLATARLAMEGTVHALAAAVELRDPYTSGHQRRAAKLACHIARDMGLPDEQIEGIHMAGLVHDLGKITMPSDILSKPGQLTDIEFSLLKIHPEAGYNLLKDIKFPWPLANIVAQHHERLDGSGYPSGLTGSEILLEARILAVADVVEAMASARPYRAALGIRKTLNEILQNSGVLYDSAVVDTCARLFLEKGFSFE